MLSEALLEVANTLQVAVGAAKNGDAKKKQFGELFIVYFALRRMVLKA
ncbi:MAG: hypothetical protein AB2541_16475 [Candidatus Thiodiazotropha sp.]